MDVWILSLNADGGGAPYFPHDFSHKHGVVFADRRTAEKQLETLAAEMFGTTGRRVIDKDNQVVIQGFRDGFGGAEYGSWVMIESHGVWGAAEPPLTFKASDDEPAKIHFVDVGPLVGISLGAWAAPAPQELPAVGDVATLTNEFSGSSDSGWIVSDVSTNDIGAHATITKGNLNKHLQRQPGDGRWHHTGSVYATFEAARVEPEFKAEGYRFGKDPEGWRVYRKSDGVYLGIVSKDAEDGSFAVYSADGALLAIREKRAQGALELDLHRRGSNRTYTPGQTLSYRTAYGKTYHTTVLGYEDGQVVIGDGRAPIAVADVIRVEVRNGALPVYKEA